MRSTQNNNLSHTNPKVSIGLPVYNGENFLSRALDSLLSQTFTDFELIISDNASTDDTAKICKKYASTDSRIIYHRSDINRGAAWNFNNTFHLSKGKYFKWAAHDDTHHPAFLEKCVEYLDQNPDVVLCFTDTIFIDEQGAHIRQYEYPTDLSIISRPKRFLNFASGGHIVHEIFGLIRADILRNTPLIGGYLGSDLVLLGKLSLYGRFYQIHESLFQHREHIERSMINPQGAENFTEWYDSSKKGKLVFPYWRRFYENAKNLATHPMSISEKFKCYIELFRAANWARKQMAEELTQPVLKLWK